MPNTNGNNVNGENNVGSSGGTNYNKWNKISNDLLTNLEKDDEREKEESAEALGHTRVPYSEAEAQEKAKAAMARKAKEALDNHQKRENNLTAHLDDLFSNSDSTESKEKDETEVIVNESMLGNKRVISIRNCQGPGRIILPSKLSSLPITSPSNDDDDGDNDEKPNSIRIQGIIKLFIHNCQNCTVQIGCKLITSMVEISNCTNVCVDIMNERISTIQVDLSKGVDIRFLNPNCFGGKDDKIYHAAVSDMKVQILKEDNIFMEKSMDYIKDGAVAQLNLTAEEYQFVTFVQKNSLVTERLIRVGNKSLTQSEYDKEQKRLGKLKDSNANNGVNSADEINEVVKQCITHKAEGNEAFKTGEYAQAVLHYSIAIDKSTGLTEAVEKLSLSSQDSDVSNFDERHIVFANRSACFLKLGHHEKALNDANECISINPKYVKGLFRKGLALHAMKQYQEAMQILANALKFEPKNKQIKQALQFAEVKYTMMMRKRMEG